jgi:hypothetical protein
MLPFRELEVFDAFMIDGQECDKVGTEKYLTYDELGEPESLETADPNLMVELVDDKEEEEDDLHDYFFSTLVSLIDAMERSGEKMTIKQLKKLAITSLKMGEDT